MAIFFTSIESIIVISFALSDNIVVPHAYRTQGTSWQGYGDLTEPPEVPGTGTEVFQNCQKFPVSWHGRTELKQKSRAGIKMLYPYPGYCGHGRTGLAEVSGAGIKVVQNFQKFRVRV